MESVVGAPTVVRVHPVVLFSILDHHIRRTSQARVVGALLGTRTANTIIVKNCFPTPHDETENVASKARIAEKRYIENLLSYHAQINPSEELVGWYATRAENAPVIVPSTYYFQNFFRKTFGSQLHLVLDTNLLNLQLSCKAYIPEEVKLGDKSVASTFQQVKVDLQCNEPDRIGLDCMIKASLAVKHDKNKRICDTTEIKNGIQGLEDSVNRLLQMLETVEAYVDDVLKGRRVPDHKVGTKIASVLSMVPRIQSDMFAKSFQTNFQDLLMVVYLMNMTRTQLALAERIGGAPA